jgi:hypothetical protein
MGWLILQGLMFWLCSPPIILAVLVANSRWQFTNTMTATVLGFFTAAIVTGTITNYVRGVPEAKRGVGTRLGSSL